MGVCGPRMRNDRCGFLAFCRARTARGRKVRVDVHADNLFASLSEELVFLTTEIQAGRALFEEEGLLRWLRREEAHQVMAGGRWRVVSWRHGLTVGHVEV